MVKIVSMFFAMFLILNCDGGFTPIDYSESSDEDVSVIEPADNNTDQSNSDTQTSSSIYTGKEDKFNYDDYEKDGDILKVALTTLDNGDHYSVGLPVTFKISYRVVENDVKKILFDFDDDGEIDALINCSGDPIITKTTTFVDPIETTVTVYVVDSENFVSKSTVDIVAE